MGLVVTYSSPTTPGIAGWSVDFSSAVRLGTIAGVVDEAELGAVAVSSLLFDDLDGTLGHNGDAITGLKKMALDETSAPVGDQRLWTGYVGARHYRRGTDSLRTEVMRKIDVDLVDINRFLSDRIFAPVALDATSSFVRPAETDLQRIAALLAVDFLSDTLYDEGLVATTGAVAMDACDYTGQHPGDVLNDCAQQSGRNFFVTYHEATGHFQLFYHFNEDPVFDSPLQISNVLADVDRITTFAPEPDAELVRNPDRVVAAVYLPFNGSNSPAYRTRRVNACNYAWRDASAPSSNVKTLTMANVRADRYLVENGTEDDRITCTLRAIPAAKVTQIKAGQRILSKFSHLPNGSNSVWGSNFQYCRVLNRSVMANELTNVLYNMRLELSPIPAIHTLACTYVAPTGVGTVSSPDVLNGQTFSYNFISTYPGSPVYPGVQSYSGPVATNGTPNNGSAYGHIGYVDPGSGGTYVWQVVFDLAALGNPYICTLGFECTFGGTQFDLSGSDDGTTWTLVHASLGVSTGVNIYPVSPYVKYRYWKVSDTQVVPPGLAYVAELAVAMVFLWAAV